MRFLRRSLLFTLAIIFLIETWIWDSFASLGRWIATSIPFAEFKAAIARAIDKMPPYAALLLFIIPAIAILPFKIGGLWLIAHGHFLAGGGVFLSAKVAGVGIAAFLFELTREKLMSMSWLARTYGTVMRWRDWAHRLVDPYMSTIKAQARTLKAMILRSTAGERGRLAKTIARLRDRIRRLRTQG